MFYFVNNLLLYFALSSFGDQRPGFDLQRFGMPLFRSLRCASAMPDLGCQISFLAEAAMMYRTLAVLFLCGSTLLAGCTTPIATGESSEGITIKRDPALYSEADTGAIAKAHCEKYGRTARHQRTEGLGFLGFVYDRFDCLEQ